MNMISKPVVSVTSFGKGFDAWCNLVVFKPVN